MPDPDWWEALWPRPREVLAELGLEPDMEVVDLCCGDGLFTAPRARMVHHVVALDLDRRMLDLSRAKIAAAGAENCKFIEGDAYDVAALVSRPVNFVLMANTFHGVPEKERLARAVATILRRGGRFAVVNWHRRGNHRARPAARASHTRLSLFGGRGDALKVHEFKEAERIPHRLSALQSRQPQIGRCRGSCDPYVRHLLGSEG